VQVRVTVHPCRLDDSDAGVTGSKPLIRRVRSAGVKTASVVATL
jgi:hypothetical protein